MTSNETEEVLKGLTTKVYKFVLKRGEPTGIREVQRGLKLSSPTLASYHLKKLEETGLLKQTTDGYVVDKVFLRNLIRFRRMLIPKYFFYSVFFVLALALELTIFKPAVLFREYVFAVGITCVAALSYIYETIRALSKEGIG